MDWKTGLAIAWLVGFSFWYYSLSLPNLGLSRSAVWENALTVFDLVDPPGENDGWGRLFGKADIVLVAALILAGAWGGGELLLRAVRVPLAARTLERTALAFGLGLSLLSLLTLLCGLAGLLSQALLLGLVLLGPAVELFLRFRAHAPDNADSRMHEPTPISWSVVLAIAPFALAILLGSMQPSMEFDVREYHLQGPKEFFQAGRITMLEHNVYTNFPFLTEMLSLLGMVVRDDWFRGALVGKAVLMCFQPLTALALFAAGRRWFGAWVGWLAVLVFLTTPWAFRISIIAYAEGGLSFYLFSTLLAVMLCIDAMRRQQDCRSLALLAGLLAGSGMACKYPGLIQVVFPMGAALAAAPFVLKLPAESRTKTARNAAGLFCLGTALTIGPWLLKNLVETGNPIYPLAYSVFGGADWNAAADLKWRDGHSSTNFSLGTLASELTNATVHSDWTSALLYGLAPLALLVSVRRKAVGWLWAYVAFLLLAWWGLTHRIDRFWVPMIPVVALLAGIGAASIRNKLWQIAIVCAVVPSVLFNLVLITTGASGFNRFHASVEDARRTTEAWPESVALLNAMSLSSADRVLFVGEAQVFDARFNHVYNTVFDFSIFEEWCAAPDQSVPANKKVMRDPQAIRRILVEAGVTYVYVNWGEVMRYRAPGSYGYTDFVAPKRFVWLQQQGVLGAEMPIPPEVRLGEFAQLSKESREDIVAWGPELRTTVRDPQGRIVDAWIKGQLFPVLPP